MSIVDRAALESSPLADLHAMASELSIDGYRRLRRPELIDAILSRQEGRDADAPSREEPEDQDERREELPDAEELAEAVADELKDDEAGGKRRRRGRRGGRGRGTAREDEQGEEGGEPSDDGEQRDERPPSEEIIEGVVALVPNGSGFVRIHPGQESDDDVYISAAQVKRCELLSGDRVAGPRRPPRRSERFASMVRIDTINGQPAEEVADTARFDDLPAAFPSELLALGAEDPTMAAIELVAPIGKGSRVTITGGPGTGKTEALRRLVFSLIGHQDLHVLLVLVGVRPEEISDWEAGPLKPAAAVNFAASADAQSQALEPVIDQARRWAARGSHAVVLIDTLDGLHPPAARKAMASARRILGGGTLTVVATAGEAVGGETTVIALDASKARAGSFPAVDVGGSATMRPELLVGEEGAQALARTRAQALGG
ncbi:MAG TPA: Rho termination factor N-terminal domain-containing protein [Solirubrobacteraceae bacterium]|nr:Rho termination factor N-terminal domain-containing protein [Solirubrobacteraceae bacterium]